MSASRFYRKLATLVRNQIRNSSTIDTNEKVLTIAIIGSPNAGKSTLVNSMVGARVSAVSHVAHTTRTFSNGILNSDNTQLVFTDTPGVVSHHEGRRLKMDKNHIRAPKRVAGSADMLAVVTDVSFRKTKDYIDESILSIMNNHCNIPAILIMNKVDMLKRKEDLLFLTTMLMQDRKKDEWGYQPFGGSSRFKECFYISAKTGDGVDPLVKYFLSQAKHSNWQYSSDIYCDASVEAQIAEVFREKVLLLFSQEIPWQVKQETILFHEDNGVVRIHQKLTWPKKSQRRYVMTKYDELVELSKEELEYLFQCPIHITLDISQKDKMTKDDLMYF